MAHRHHRHDPGGHTIAINETPDARCEQSWHRPGTEPPAAAISRHPGFEWVVVCDACIQRFRDDPDPIPIDVVYLDPAGQRRPESFELHLDTGTFTYHNHVGYAGHQRVPCNDGCHPYTEPIP